MLGQKNIAELLSGKLKESEIRQRLLDLTPDKLDTASFQRCIDEVKQFCSPDYAKLAGLGGNTMDCSGTGGSGRPRFNTSTAAAFVLSAAKVPVAKFGNRAATSKSGSFDVLNQLNITEKIDAKTAARIMDAAGLVFIFAPMAYPALGALSAVRATMGVSTVFNFIGPLLNPVSPAYRVLGVADPIMQMFVAAFIKETAGTAASMVVRSACGLDEICPRCGTNVKEVRRDKMTELHLPGKGTCSAPERQHSPAENAEILIRIVQGKDTDSYEYELICQNAGAGLFVSGKAGSVEEGIELAKQLIASGDVQNQMTKVKEAYDKYAS